jgi:tetratricopeptide (TPR) repeat protein
MMERRRGNQAAATELADRLSTSHPESGMGFLIKGQLLMDSEDYPSAADLLNTAYAINNDSITLSRYYTALASAGELEKAETVMADWLAANPDDIAARLAWADQASREGDTARAVEQYEQVAGLDPKNVAVLVRLANAYHVLGDRRDLKTAQQAYELDSEDLYAKHLYGWLLVETGLSDRGAQLLGEVVERAPDNITFRVHLAVALAGNDREDEANITLQPLLDAGVPLGDMPEASALLDRLGIKR